MYSLHFEVGRNSVFSIFVPHGHYSSCLPVCVVYLIFRAGSRGPFDCTYAPARKTSEVRRTPSIPCTFSSTPTREYLIRTSLATTARKTRCEPPPDNGSGWLRAEFPIPNAFALLFYCSVAATACNLCLSASTCRYYLQPGEWCLWKNTDSMCVRSHCLSSNL